MRVLAAILLLLLALPAHAQSMMQNALVVSSCGGQTLAAGPLTNLTMNPQGQLCLVGIGGGTAPPTNSVAPVASGSLTIGSLLTTTNGTWSGSPTFTYQWQRGGATIAGATAQTYTTVSADGGTAVGAQVTATNGGGSASALSNTLAITPGNMATPIFVAMGTTVPSTSVTTYLPFGASAFGWNATLASREIASPIAGVISGLEVSSSSVSGGYYQIKVYVAATGTSVTCSFGLTPGGVNYGSATGCSDLTDTATVNAGDLLAVESSINGTPTGISANLLKISALFTSTNGQESLIPISSATASQTAINYIGPLATATNFQITDALASWVMPTAGTLDKLNIQMSAAAGASKLFTFTVFQNNAATGVFAGDATHCGGASSLSCSDLTHSITVAAGDTISVQTCPSAAAPLSGANCPTGSAPSNVLQSASLRFVPSTPNQAVIFANSTPTVTASNYFVPVWGNGAGSSGETGPQTLVPGLPGTTHMVFGNLTTALCPDPASGVTRTSTGRMNAVSQTPTVALVGSGTISCPTLQTLRDTADSFQASAGALVNILTKLNTITGASTPIEFKASMTAVVQ